MQNVSKGFDIRQVFPIYAVENDFLISKSAEITAAYKLVLPEIFTLSKEDYEGIHSVWLRAIKVLPAYTIISKQDWFTKSTHDRTSLNDDATFLENAYRKHFSGRPYLKHSCYLYITKSRKGRSKIQSVDSMLLRGHIVPQEVNSKSFDQFADSILQFEQILKDSGIIQIERVGTDGLLGTKENEGILGKYMNLTQEDNRLPLQDFVIDDDGVKIGDNRIVVHTISSADQVSPIVSTDLRYEQYSTENCDCLVSFVAPLGLLLTCNHIYNQVIFIEDSDEIKRELEKTSDKMYSLQQLSSSNLVNKEFIDAYLELSSTLKLTSVRCHCNVMAWSDDKEELRQIKNEVGSSIAKIGCRIHHNTTDSPVLFWSSIPGNAGDFPREETYITFLENALCFFASETNYQDSPSPKGIRLSDRITGKPVHVDISDHPQEVGIITNGNKFVIGPSGSGKSFAMNHFLRHYYEQDSHIIIVDMGNSYEAQCIMINEATKGEDGIYYTYTEENPIAFNPFFTEDKIYDVEKKDSLKTLILSLWRREGNVNDTERVTVERAVSEYIKQLQSGKVKPSFNTFYEFVDVEFREALQNDPKFKPDMFDIDNFLYVLQPYYKGGEFDYLLNSEEDLDLLNKRFIVFEIDAIRDNKTLFPVVTLVIMEAYVNKMRRLKDIRKILMMEEAWKAIAKDGMAEYIKYLYKTVRKYYGEVIMVTQEIEDILDSEIVKDSIVNNSGCKILLDQSNYKNKFGNIQKLLALSDKDKAQILSINRSNRPNSKYKECWIGLGGKQSAVYAIEVSRKEAWCYTTKESEKHRLFSLYKKLGSMHKAIEQLSN
ncbi:TraG family conjugative transposon ATPase [Massilibacteroides vaginae]|uniref:TraG family conjugative transposon ATPase n=1 Tax=Massilibacteroides vaginae TaxID=1673718 RepID=UPI000A1CDB41|nr:TraG family conjugative transposon ATPase [Massilibacteroides vaginae]